MTAHDDIQVIFHGVRGSMPVTSAQCMRYGGNTACVEVRCGDHTLILDGGTGMYAHEGAWEGVREADIFLSHTHIDHVMGLPFFPLFYRPEARIRVWAGHLAPTQSIQAVAERLISPPLFPLMLSDFKAQVEWRDFRAGEALSAPAFNERGIAVRTVPLNHPDRATGYRIEYAGLALCYLTDLEHTQGVVDPALVAFIRQADGLIYDSTYDDEEFERYRGWGHSTWQQAVRLAQAGEVRAVAAFHHDPAADDATLDARALQLSALLPGSVMASEGLTLSLKRWAWKG